MSRLAEELALTLGCPVQVIFLDATREVVVVAHVEPSREVKVTLPVSVLGFGLTEDRYAALKYDLLKQLRGQMSQEPADG